MIATAHTSVLLSVVAVCLANPYYLAPHQQRQLFYPMVPQYSPYSVAQYSAPVVSAPSPYRQFYYAPQAPASANLVSSVPSALRYSAPVVAPAKQVFYYPGASPIGYPGNYILAGDDNAGEAPAGSWFSNSWFSNFPSFSNPFSTGQPASPENPAAAGGEGAAGAAPAAAPEKTEQAAEQPAKEEDNEKEVEEKKPAEEAKVKGVPQKYVVLGQPQFFGNLGLQRVVNPAQVIPSADHGAVSSYLLLKNFPGVRFAPPVPLVPQVPQAPLPAHDSEVIPAGEPGSAALGYQKLLQAARQQKDYDDSSSITVDAASVQRDSASEDKPASETVEADKESEDEETGTNE